ncbi:MAG: rhodanese-like domain-containing protein [Myxococcales bacterium]|nr:rhodanese-like domain-containing protein [Myxococcales bacterium]
MIAVLLLGCGPRAKLELTEAYVSATHRRVPQVEPADAAALVASGKAVLVDVRPPEERDVSRIPGAIDREAVEADPEAFGDVALIAYCTVGQRSSDWARDQRALGLDARNLEGSVLAWVWDGRELEHDGAPTHRVHTWSADFAWVPPGWEAVFPVSPGP